MDDEKAFVQRLKTRIYDGLDPKFVSSGNFAEIVCAAKNSLATIALIDRSDGEEVSVCVQIARFPFCYFQFTLIHKLVTVC